MLFPHGINIQMSKHMVIGIFGESCTGKSTLADKIAAALPCDIYTDKDYLRLARCESIAKALFQKKLAEAVSRENIIYVISELEHMDLLPKQALGILVTAHLELIKSRFAQRMHGTLPESVAAMLERRHGCFDVCHHDLHVTSGRNDLEEVVREILNQI